MPFATVVALFLLAVRANAQTPPSPDLAEAYAQREAALAATPDESRAAFEALGSAERRTDAIAHPFKAYRQPKPYDLTLIAPPGFGPTPTPKSD
jgi:hypothetical protein